jgi:hypothetical protein
MVSGEFPGPDDRLSSAEATGGSTDAASRDSAQSRVDAGGHKDFGDSFLDESAFASPEHHVTRRRAAARNTATDSGDAVAESA